MAFARSDEAKQAKWFSRRYQSSQGLSTYRDNRDKAQAAKSYAESQRDAAARARTPNQQLVRLDALLGKGLGALRERSRLVKLIKAGMGDDACLGPV